MNFDVILFYTFITINIVMMIYWLKHESRGYGFPFFAGGIAVAMVLPQGLALLKAPDLLPRGAFSLTMFFASLCTLAIWSGFSLGLRCSVGIRILEADAWDDDTLLRCATVFTLLGTFFYIVLQNMTIRTAGNGNWTGAATIVVFFAQYLKVGMVISMYLLLKKHSRWTLFLLAVGLVFMIPQVLFYGRRAETMQLLCLLIMPLWFVRKKAVPRVIFVVIIIGLILLMSATAVFRKAMRGEEDHSYIYRLEQVDVIDAWYDTTESGGGLELLNCIYAVNAANELMKFDFGTPVWNWIVWSYVPGQWVGNLKQRLYIMVNWPPYRTTYERYPYYSGLSGSMWLGYSDAFQSYWWYGFIPFFIISWFMGCFYRMAESGGGASISLYTWYMTPALHVIPGMTYVFWTNMVYLWVFCLPIILLCRSQRNNHSLTPLSLKEGTK